MLLLSPEIEEIPAHKVLLNIGGTLDIPTGEWVTGIHGESILNGGLGTVTGRLGPGNSFKSTLLHCELLRGMGVVFDSCEVPKNKSQKKLKRLRSSKTDYDTETNVKISRLQTLSANVPELHGQDLFDRSQPLWKVTDKTVMWGNTFFEKMKEFCKYKTKNAKDYLVTTPLVDKDGKTQMKVILPTFGMIDSLTDFQTETEEEIMNKNELGDAGANTLNARSNLFKSRLLQEITHVCAGSYHYVGLIAQMNDEMQMGGAPGGASAPPPKRLQFMTTGKKAVGVTNKFTYATSISHEAKRAAPLVDKDRQAEYTHPTGMRFAKDTDLMKVTCVVIRNKNGLTGIELPVITTQREGFDPTLTEFDNIRENGRFGIIGSGQWYNLALYPECSIQRTNIRKKIQEDPKLVRAINITSEMQQISTLMPDVWSKYGCDPKVLYEDLKKQGYDWDLILSQTRGAWRFNNEYHPKPFLSTLDLLKMRKGLYFPYWMTEDKKGIKEEYQFEYEAEDYPMLDTDLLESTEEN